MKPRPFDDALLTKLAREQGTPLWVYDAETIRMRMRELSRFDVVRYAQKANSNLAILDLVRRAGGELDAVSAGEIARGLAAGFAPEQIVFTADLFDARAIEAIVKHKVPVNLGSHFMIEQYAKIRPGGEVTLRVNPGFGHGHARKVNTGGETSKHGIWHAQIPDVIELAHRHELRVHGLHVHIGSGSDFENLARVRGAMKKIARAAGPDLVSLSAGGGLPIPYRADEPVFDVKRFSDAWLEMKAEIERDLGRKIALEVEPGRYLVAESGCLLTQVRGTKRSGKYDYVFVDAGFNTLIRPAMYGAFHQISAVGRAQAEYTHPRIVAGPLCESADVFTQGREGVLTPQLLPDVQEGDLLCIHDAGAYGAAMSSNYNSQPFAAEILVENGNARLIRRRQTLEELLAPETGL